jgi:2'-5' RNA ligase superfamily
MAGEESADSLQKLEVTSYETALCVVPPLSYCREVDKLRELYDKAYGRWPPHINLIYPFVGIDHLP